jgi:arylsulfatase A-like enzyme
MLNASRLVGTHDVLFVTLDTLRFDVAACLHAAGRTPHLSAILPSGGWEKRHTPGSFTFAAHAAFFAGFLPTPALPGKHPRLFALRFPGSETTSAETAVFDAPDIVAGFRDQGYHTLCVGGVGFFNKLTPLGSVLPGLFDESHWSPELGVIDPRSTENQVNLVLGRVGEHPACGRVFVFLNVSAIHQPNRFYLPGAADDTIESHAAALEYVDKHLGRLFTGLRKRGPWLVVICSDHGTAYGEDGYTGHRLAHPVVWEVPYAEFVLDRPAQRNMDVPAGAVAGGELE